MSFWASVQDMARAPPRAYPASLPPMTRTPTSMTTPSMAIATMGPRRTALGEADFIRAAMIPARRMSPG